MSDEFEDRVRSWLRERGRTERGLLASVAGHVAVLPPRRPDRRRPLVVIAATLLLAVVALYALLPRVGQVGSPDASSDSPQPTLVRYAGDGFTFDYPATWQVISGFEHAGLHGPTVAAAVGTGGFDLGCVTTPPSGGDLGGVGCPAEPRWDVPDDGVVVAYWARAHLGTPWQTALPTLAAGEHWQQVGGRPAAAFDDPGSPSWQWRLAVEPWVIEVRFGPTTSPATRAAVRALVVSWQWQDAPPAAPTVTPQPTPEPTPSWAADIVGNLACEGEVAPIGAGGSPGDIAGGSEAGTAKWSLYAFLSGDAHFYATLPLAGYEVVEQSPSWALYAHAFEGRNRAVALFHKDGRSWSLWQVAACDPVEFDPGAPLSIELEFWTDAAGNRLPTTQAYDRPDCYGGIRLRVDGHLFVADPVGAAYDSAQLHGTYERGVKLPPDAVDTGYRSGERRLYLAGDELAAYVITSSGVERWPRVRGDDYIRVDCN